MTENALTSSLQFPAPDLDTLRDNSRQLRHQSHALDAIYLPVLGEKLKVLMIELDVCNDQMRNVLTSTPDALDTAVIVALLDILKASQNQPEDVIAGVVEELRREFKTHVDATLTSVATERTLLDNALTNFKAVSLKGADPDILKLEEALKSLRERVAAEKAPLAGLIEKENKITDLLEALDAVSVLDKLKPLIDTLKSLLDIDPSNPLVDSIKVGLAAAVEILGIIQEEVKYDHLLKERTRLQNKQDEINARVKELEARNGEESRKLAQLQSFKALGTPRDVYTQEARKLVEALQVFVKQSRIDESADLAEEAALFISHCEQMADYLVDLWRRWQDASAR